MFAYSESLSARRDVLSLTYDPDSFTLTCLNATLATSSAIWLYSFATIESFETALGQKNREDP